MSFKNHLLLGYAGDKPGFAHFGFTTARAVLVAAAMVNLPGANAAFAQEGADCTNPQTQMEMNLCAQQGFKAADEDLNYTYALSMDYMKRLDEYLPDDLVGAADALRDAERAWIQYRDNNCRAEGFAARGGSMEPLLVYSCLERLTRNRTEELRSLTEEN